MVEHRAAAGIPDRRALARRDRSALGPRSLLRRRAAPRRAEGAARHRAVARAAGRVVPFDRIDANVEAGLLRAFAVPATNLYTADGVFFVDARSDVPLWRRGRFSVERTRIRVDHLMASSAIPVFFPSVEIEGRHFGDGSIRNTAPLSPAIHLGADRIVAIGVRRAGLPPEKAAAGHRSPPTIAQVAGALLDAVMLDAIEVDVEHSVRVNTSVLTCATGNPREPFRSIDVLWLSPSCGFGRIAAELADHIPGVVRYLMRGLGPDDATAELASYLLFDAVYCSRLMEIGRADVQARRDEILAFFAQDPPSVRQRERASKGGA